MKLRGLTKTSSPEYHIINYWKNRLVGYLESSVYTGKLDCTIKPYKKKIDCKLPQLKNYTLYNMDPDQIKHTITLKLQEDYKMTNVLQDIDFKVCISSLQSYRNIFLFAFYLPKQIRNRVTNFTILRINYIKKGLMFKPFLSCSSAYRCPPLIYLTKIINIQIYNKFTTTYNNLVAQEKIGSKIKTCCFLFIL